MAAVADARSREEGRLGLVPGRPAAGGPAERGRAAAASVPGMVDAAAAAAPGSGSSTPRRVGAEASRRRQLGVHETGVNTGAEVDKYLAAAGVGPGNPWCASFVTWSLEQAGHKMPGSGWAAVQTWVRNAEAKQNDLQVVSADQARPGDIVAYDWGRQEDFGSDGHIGFLASNVQGGKFTALEGNNQDAVMKVPRDVNMANVKFIRIGGDAPPPRRRARGAPAAGARRRRAPTPPPRRSAVGGGADPYPGDNASKEQLAAWLGREAEKRGLPKQLPVMASLVESGVKNLNYGDADSVGFFQMRVGIWNKGAYAGFPEKPELQVKWFLDQAEAVKKQRIAARQVGHRPEAVRRLDRRHRAPRRAVPRPLPAAPRRGQRAARASAGGAPAPPVAAPVAAARRRARRPPTPRPRRAAERRRRRRRARRRSRRSPRPRSTRASRTSGAARRRRPASTAPASCSGPTRRPASRSRA